VGLTDIRTIGQGNLGGCGRCALRVTARALAAVNSECTIVLNGRIQGNVAAAGGLGGSITVARQAPFFRVPIPLPGPWYPRTQVVGRTLTAPTRVRVFARVCLRVCRLRG